MRLFRRGMDEVCNQYQSDLWHFHRIVVGVGPVFREFMLTTNKRKVWKRRRQLSRQSLE